MKKITAGQIIDAIGGKLFSGNRETAVTGVEMDSRIMKEGDCFFALPGERVDGNDFMISAFEKGAVCAVATDEEKAKKALEIFADRTIIITGDSEKALRDLSKWYIGTFDNLKKIAVTGSNGKTTTKDMIHAICAVKYRTQKTPVNRNNLIGLPLTVLSLEEDTEVAVLELGMDAFNEIRTMADIVKPDVAVITNVGTAHVERLGSREGILRAKLEITEFLKPENVLIIPDGGDMLTRESAKGNYKLLSAGNTGRNEYIISNVVNNGEEGMTFSLEYDGDYNKFELKVPGEYNVSNASLAIAAASQIGVTAEEAAKGLLEFRPSDKRMNMRGSRGIKVIDDTYNASPPAMKAALDVLKNTAGIRKVALLGDMFELGEESAKYHREAGEYAASCGVKLFIGVGTNMKYACDGAASVLGEENVMHFETKEELLEIVRDIVKSGDVVLVKGSRGMAMEVVVKKILE